MKHAVQNPFVLGLVGLALMIAGWQVGSIQPDDSERRLNVAREEAEKGELSENPKHVTVIAPRTPPYRLVGRLTFYLGLLLFVVAAVQMWTQPVPPKEDADNEDKPEVHEEEPEERVS